MKIQTTEHPLWFNWSEKIIKLQLPMSPFLHTTPNRKHSKQTQKARIMHGSVSNQLQNTSRIWKNNRSSKQRRITSQDRNRTSLNRIKMGSNALTHHERHYELKKMSTSHGRLLIDPTQEAMPSNSHIKKPETLNPRHVSQIGTETDATRIAIN